MDIEILELPTQIVPVFAIAIPDFGFADDARMAEGFAVAH